MKQLFTQLFQLLTGSRKSSSKTRTEFPVLLGDHAKSSDIAYDGYLAVSEWLGEDWSDYWSRIRSLPQHWRAVWTAHVLDGEVNNGGHHQFFWNTDSAIDSEVSADLLYLKATPYALLFEEALQIKAEYDYLADKESTGNSWEGFTEGSRDGRLEAQNKAYYAQEKGLLDYVAEHMQLHLDLYLNAGSNEHSGAARDDRG